MTISKKAKKASDFIKYETGKTVIEKPFDLSKISKRKENIDHGAMANALIKIINTTPGLSDVSKKVMSMKIINPGITNMGIALQLGMREYEVTQWENHGKEVVKTQIDRCSLEDHIGRANTDRAVETAVKNLNLTGKNNELLKRTHVK